MAKELFLVNSSKKAIIDNEDYEWAMTLPWYITKNGVATPVLTPDGFKVWLYQRDMVAAKAGMIPGAKFVEIDKKDIPDWNYANIKFIPLTAWADL